VAWPNVPIVFCETRKLAEEWVCRFLAAARVWVVGEDFVPTAADDEDGSGAVTVPAGCAAGLHHGDQGMGPAQRHRRARPWPVAA
jgi:hypothetical protein